MVSPLPVKFRTLLWLGTVPLVLATLALAVVTATLMLTHAARREVEDALDRSRRVFEDLQSYRQSLYAAQARVVAEEPRLRAVVAALEVDAGTIGEVAREIRSVVRSDLFLIADPEGRVRVALTGRAADRALLEKLPAIRTALGEGHAAGLWSDPGGAYQIEAQRLAFQAAPVDRVVGAVVLGYRIDDRMAEVVHRQTGSTVLVVADGRLIASAPEEDRPVIDQLLPHLAGSTAGRLQLAVGDGRYLAAWAGLPGVAGDHRFRYAVVESLDRALAPARRLSLVLLAILGAAMIVGIASGVVVARRLSRPLEALVKFTRRIAAGELEARAAVEGAGEIQALGEAMNGMAEELLTSRREVARRERLEKELEIAARIQVALLPEKVVVPGLEVATHMAPATEVGGDYFDVIPDERGCWICIGDVAGHGLTAGLVTVMLQSAIASVIEANPGVQPIDLVATVNTVIYENVRRRLKQKEHVTLTVLRYEAGSICHAGAHEDILVCRAAGGPCQRLPTPGAWVGVDPAIRRLTVESRFELQEGDLVVLYTDGVIEAQNAGHEQLGLDRLCAEIEAHRHRPAADLRTHLVERLRAFSPAPDDDTTLMVLRRTSA
jgi:sigma-B regulation protein RsbU (phosphoserine phosphatase)